MPMFPFNDWCDEAIYQDEMARMHKITPKQDVIDSLYDEFKRISNDPSYKPQLTKEQRHWLLVALSGQIVALSMELTDDLAFVCEAYLKSIKNRDKKVVEYIANLERQDAQDFFVRVARNITEAVEAVGLDPTACSSDQNDRYRSLFEQIQEVRDHFWPWYNGYKHGQYATPIMVGGGTPLEKWGLYLIPKKLERDALNRVHTKGKERFIDTVRFVDEFVKLAQIAVQLWDETRKRQYPKVFGKVLV